ncbi:MAG: redoxin domain-containing protein [Verrucomicrobia bacterium]|nr:redoxin domain-containing protein [Verrucomicrobiota bacterium]
MNNQRAILAVLLWLALAVSTPAQPPKLSAERREGLLRLGLQGAAGHDYLIEASTNPGAATWQPLLTLTLTDGFPGWSDPASLAQPHRFYRAIKLDGPAPRPPVGNFRLLDHEGTSRELYYYSDTRAVVLVFTGNDRAIPENSLATLGALRDRFAPQGAEFWLVNASPPSPLNAAPAQANPAPVNLPVLQDEAQLVARELSIGNVGEVIAIDPADWTSFYRGALDDRLDPSEPESAARQHYLADALANFLAGRAVALSRTPPSGAPLVLAVDPPPSYAGDIAPLLQSYCVRCHSPGNIAPWAMTSHEIVKDYAAAIKDQVLTRRMPPWHADPRHGQFGNDISLPPQLAAKLIQWISAGAPRGEGPDPLTEAPPPPPDWPLGQPDYVVTIDRQDIPATGTVPYKYLVVPSPVLSNAWLRAAVLRPGNAKVLHHCLVFVGTSIFDILDLQGGLRGFYAAHVPGMNQGPYPDGTGKYLKKGSYLVFQMHYTTTGQAETDQTQVGLYLAPAAPALELKTSAAYTLDLEIPPGAKDYERAAELSFAHPVWLYEFSPHMHYRGARFKFTALYPDGTSEVLLSVPKYDFHWQTLYRLAQPKRLPAGTRVVCHGAYDNSPQNPANPDPAATVHFGEQTWDEMFIGYMNFAEIP